MFKEELEVYTKRTLDKEETKLFYKFIVKKLGRFNVKFIVKNYEAIATSEIRERLRLDLIAAYPLTFEKFLKFHFEFFDYDFDKRVETLYNTHLEKCQNLDEKIKLTTEIVHFLRSINYELPSALNLITELTKNSSEIILFHKRISFLNLRPNRPIKLVIYYNVPDSR